VGHEKMSYFTFVHMFANYWPIIKILSMAHCREFEMPWLLYIPPDRKCVFTLPCEI